MPKWLDKIGDAGKAAGNIAASVGPWLISQSDKSSEAYARHQARLATVETNKDLVTREIENYADIQKVLLEKWASALPEERLRIKRDLQEVDATLRQFAIAQKGISYLSLGEKTQATNDQSAEMSPHWIDKFNELSRSRNEPWRAELLARALATEAAEPGSVPPRTLWALGTLEKRIFNSFSLVLDLCSYIAYGPMIPNHAPFEREPVPNKEEPGVTIGHLLFRLAESGLLADTHLTKRELVKDGEFPVAYQELKYSVGCPQPLIIRGVVLTRLGESVASFYEPRFNELGKKIFEAWIASIDPQAYVIKPDI